MSRGGAARRAWGLHAAVIGGAAAAVAVDRRWRTTRPALAAAGLPIVTIGFTAALRRLERRHPYRSEWRPDAAETRTDAAFLASSIVASAAGQVAAESVRQTLRGRPGRDLGLGRRVPTPVGVAAGLLVSDFVHTQWHHLSHVWGPAWRLHAVHHSPTRLYWLNATRFHALDLFVEAFVDTLAFGFLGLGRDQYLGFRTIRSTYGQLQHCNVDVRSGVLDRVFATPDLHRWHHSTVYAEGDTNYGAVLSVWDQVFGWFFRPPAREAPDELGIGRMPDFPQRFGELHRVPLAWDRIRRRNAESWYGEPVRRGASS